MRNGALFAAAMMLIVAAAAADETTPLLPANGIVLVPVGEGDNAKDYVLVGPQGAEFHLDGAGTLSGWVRLHLAPDHDSARTVTVHAEGVPGLEPLQSHEFKPSASWAYDDGRDGRPSGGRKFDETRVPVGVHTLRIAAPGETLLLRLTWEPDEFSGKEQPASAAIQASPPKDPSPWKTSITVGLETIYDDNFLRYSGEFQTDLLSGQYPHKYQADGIESHIMAPSLDVYAQRRFWSQGNTRFRFKVKRWQYFQGDLKTNMSFDYQVRQFFKGGKNLELGYNYAPQQYIRELSDRPPGSGEADPVEYGEFRYTRNVFTAIWRQELSRAWDLKLTLDRSLRYYNRPYMENDIKDLGLRATLFWAIHRDWKITADYGYTDAPARGWDEVGETRESSDDSDPSYNEDLYQLDVDWSPGWAEPVFDSVGIMGRHQVAWFTSEKSVEADPYHAGRIDRVYQAALTFDRKLSNGMNVQVGMQYALRRVESPWDGDISEDKNYDQRRYWIGLTYKL